MSYLLRKAMLDGEARKRAKVKVEMDQWKKENNYTGYDNLKIREGYESAKDMKKEIMGSEPTQD